MVKKKAFFCLPGSVDINMAGSSPDAPSETSNFVAT